MTLESALQQGKQRQTDTATVLPVPLARHLGKGKEEKASTYCLI
jgi:hypothetical protein